MLSFGQRLKTLRREANLSQADIAEQIGVSVQSVSKWECDNAMPDISQIVPLSAVLNVSTDCLLGVGTDEKSDREELDKKIREISVSASYTPDMNYEIYLLCKEFLKKYPLNYDVKLFCSVQIYNYILNTDDTSDEKKEQLYSEAMRMLTSIRDRDTDPGRQIEARFVTVYLYALFKEEWDKAEAAAMDIPNVSDGAPLRSEALYNLAVQKEDYDRALELSEELASEYCSTYTYNMWQRARRISIFGQVRKEEAIAAWKDAEYAARENLRLFLNKKHAEFSNISRNPYTKLFEVLFSMSGDYLALSDVESALGCVERMTDAAEEYYAWMKENCEDEKLFELSVMGISDFPRYCYNSVIEPPDNILTREPRYKACVERLKALKS